MSRRDVIREVPVTRREERVVYQCDRCGATAECSPACSIGWDTVRLVGFAIKDICPRCSEWLRAELPGFTP